MAHYRYECASTKQYSSKFHNLWEKYYVHDRSRVKNVRLIVGMRTHPSLEHRLVSKKSVQTVLANK